jgi:hypothetical protein
MIKRFWQRLKKRYQLIMSELEAMESELRLEGKLPKEIPIFPKGGPRSTWAVVTYWVVFCVITLALWYLMLGRLPFSR